MDTSAGQLLSCKEYLWNLVDVLLVLCRDERQSSLILPSRSSSGLPAGMFSSPSV